MTEAVIANIETGRKTDPTVSQLLTLSRALDVSPLMLMAPLGDPSRHVTPLGMDEPIATFIFDAWWSVGDRHVEPMFYAQQVREDFDTVRVLRRAVGWRAEFFAWKARHAAAAEAEDWDAIAEAAAGMDRMIEVLLQTISVLSDQGLPVAWLSPDSDIDDAAAADTDQ